LCTEVDPDDYPDVLHVVEKYVTTHWGKFPQRRGLLITEKGKEVLRQIEADDKASVRK
jgi:hypothetical protein